MGQVEWEGEEGRRTSVWQEAVPRQGGLSLACGQEVFRPSFREMRPHSFMK